MRIFYRASLSISVDDSALSLLISHMLLHVEGVTVTGDIASFEDGSAGYRLQLSSRVI